jgi:hypothetical protein
MLGKERQMLRQYLLCWTCASPSKLVWPQNLSKELCKVYIFLSKKEEDNKDLITVLFNSGVGHFLCIWA